MMITRTFDERRARMVERQLRRRGIADERVLVAMGRVPREAFVPPQISDRAYDDAALPIGEDQTISQPYIVARMTEALLQGGPLRKVLEIGTGCGYQTSMLAPFAEKIFSVERVEPLVKRAKERLRDLDIKNVRLKHGDGMKGWPTQAPFDCPPRPTRAATASRCRTRASG